MAPTCAKHNNLPMQTDLHDSWRMTAAAYLSSCTSLVHLLIHILCIQHTSKGSRDTTSVTERSSKYVHGRSHHLCSSHTWSAFSLQAMTVHAAKSQRQRALVMTVPSVQLHTPAVCPEHRQARWRHAPRIQAWSLASTACETPAHAGTMLILLLHHSLTAILQPIWPVLKYQPSDLQKLGLMTLHEAARAHRHWWCAASA